MLTIGYARSGGTLLAMALNAHPEMVIANEAVLLNKLDFPFRLGRFLARGRIVRLVVDKDRKFRRDMSYTHTDYPYSVENQWQGRYSRLRVIGNKNGPHVARRLESSPELLDSLRRQISAPVRALFTIRNPYDVIATQYLRDMRIEGKIQFASVRDYNPEDAELLQLGQEHISRFRQITDKILRALPMFPKEDVFPVRHEKLVASSKNMLREICAFLGVEPTEEYLDACASIVWAAPHPSRFKVRWTPRQIAEVAGFTEQYSWLRGYGFEDRKTERGRRPGGA